MRTIGSSEDGLPMHEDDKQRSPNILKLGCLLTSALALASVFLAGAILSTGGIGVVGKSNTVTVSPVGSWTLPNGTIQKYNADGTGSATTRDGTVTYFEWRSKGNELALYIYGFASPNRDVRTRIVCVADRLMRGVGLMGERGSVNYLIVEVTADKLTLAIDEERVEPPQRRGDQLECTAVAKNATTKPAAANGE